MKIVIADDSSLLRDRIKSLLNGLKEKLVLYEAENGLEALKLVKDEKPDLAILDIRMPEMNGIVRLITLILNIKRGVLKQALIIFSAKQKNLKILRMSLPIC